MSPEAVPQTIRSSYDADRKAIELRLGQLLEALASEHRGMREAMSWSLLGGGKRLRPVLCLWTHDLVGGSDRDTALDAACAVECLHTYSLIHDDLPCMDDDDLRRGKPSSHVQFGEATAVLAGDGLLTLAFQILSTLPERHDRAAVEYVLAMIKVLAVAAGTGGLITGQALDLSGSARSGDLEAVRRIHHNKTARLIAAAMEIGAVAGGAGHAVRERIREAGLLAGEAFQITDDILDCEQDGETLGKTPGKDARAGKLTFPALEGVERSREEAASLIGSATRTLSGGDAAADAEVLSRTLELFAYLVSRGA